MMLIIQIAKFKSRQYQMRAVFPNAHQTYGLYGIAEGVVWSQD